MSYYFFCKKRKEKKKKRVIIYVCGGQLIPFVQIALERAGPNTQSADKRVSEDDQ